LRLTSLAPLCRECRYALSLDPYGKGCGFNCAYCYARSGLQSSGYWKPETPAPLDINSVRRLFYTVFETDRRSPWRRILERRVPIRIGYATDPLMPLERELGITRELLRLLAFYRYPHIVTTKSDLIADDEYLALLDKDLCAVQITITTLDERLARALEGTAPPPRERLRAAAALSRQRIWTAVRLTPLFPVYPDGYFTDPAFPDRDRAPSLEVFTWDIVPAICAEGIPAVVAGFGFFSGTVLDTISSALHQDLRPFFRQKGSDGLYRYSGAEQRYYYRRLHDQCAEQGAEFSVCYIGSGDECRAENRDLWADPHDCCNIRGKVKAFETDAGSIERRQAFSIWWRTLLDAVATRSYY